MEIAVTSETSEISDRIEQFRRDLGLKKNEFCREIGFSYSTYASITGPRQTKPNVQLIQLIAKRWSTVNISWLLTGKGIVNLDDEPEAKPLSYHEVMTKLHEQDEEIHSMNEMLMDKEMERLETEKFYQDLRNLDEQLKTENEYLKQDKHRTDKTIDRLVKELDYKDKLINELTPPR